MHNIIIKNVLLLLLLIHCIFLLTSCIKPEPPYMEADIETFIIDSPHFITSSISEKDVQTIVSEEADYSRLTVLMTLSPGAIVEPPSGSVIDFSNKKEVKFTVTAEDGIHKKNYTVSISSKIVLNFDFENWMENELYPMLTDLLWSTGNAGVAILGFKDFPTNKTTDCIEGKHAVKMQTMKGKEVPGLNIAIFAGSLFRGKFYPNVNEPLKSLQLGHPHLKTDGKPIYLNGYYKYKPGAIFTDKHGKVLTDRKDSLSIYSVLFKVTKGAVPNKEYLDGETVLNSEKVIARAKWSELKKPETDTPSEKGFTKFSIPFEYKEELDFNKFDYRLTIVFSSSRDGNLYAGAVGSELIIDNVEIICEPIK